jgi:hypothetical protein
MTATVVAKMASQLICGIPVLGEAASNRIVTLTAFYADGLRVRGPLDLEVDIELLHWLPPVSVAHLVRRQVAVELWVGWLD